MAKTLACWHGKFGWHRNGVIWMAVIPHCLMWCIWCERNNWCFEDSETQLELWAFLFRHTPHKTWCNCFLNLYILMLTRLSFPICKYINNTSRQDLLNPEKTKNHNPHRPSNSTRKKQMISSFLILLTHTTPVNRAGSLLACPFGWGMVIESSCSMMFGVEISHWR